MTPIFINTIEDFYRIRHELRHFMLESKKRGPIRMPCLSAVLVAKHLLRPNNYNPNFVPSNKMRELEQSILFNGWCFPVPAIFDEEMEMFVIVDGAHRTSMTGPEWLDMDYVPIVYLDHLTMVDCLIATKQFNDARGVHQVDLDAELIRRMLEGGAAEEEISERLQMDLDTIHRYKQLTGVAELFKNSAYSMSWEIVEDEEAA